MTIEDVKEELISILTEIEITGGSMVTSKYKEELKMAIDTMSKYQKIEHILKAEFEQYHPLDRGPYKLYLIGKVMEDGKID